MSNKLGVKITLNYTEHDVFYPRKHLINIFNIFFPSFPDRLYFATLKTGYKPKPTRNSKYFHIEDDIVYENFYFDFGPYHLCHLYQFCNRLNDELDKNPKKKIVFYTSNNETLRLNAAYLIGCYQVIKTFCGLLFEVYRHYTTRGLTYVLKIISLSSYIDFRTMTH